MQRFIAISCFLTVCTVLLINMLHRLEVDGFSGYFVNHKKLIDQFYTNANQLANADCYKLRDEVFIFTEKESDADGERKRKKPKTPRNSQAKIDNHINVEYIREASIKLIEAARKEIVKLPLEANRSLQPLLDGVIDFPSFNGRNDSDSIVRTTIANRQYIIPPNCTFHNTDVRNLAATLTKDTKFDFVILDPPWRNKYIRRLKAARRDLSYQMLYNDDLEEIPLGDYIHENTLVVIWCTNSNLHHKAIVDSFLPKWNLKLLTKWYWIKLNHKGELVCPFREAGQKQPFEHLFIATHKDNETFSYKEQFVISVASVIHSHKPPLLEIFKSQLPEKHRPRCLELFARYLYPGFTSVGLEVLKLQDIRLYDLQPNQQIQ